MNKEEFKNYVNEIAKNELRNSFDNNLMETLNSAFIFKYVETLEKENKELKEAIDKVSSQIKLYGKYNGEKCTRGFSMMTADFNKLLDILKEVNNENRIKK